ncbi:MAG: glycosyltransferase family 2 protein [Ignavibacteria bacterium]|nr:glycosyltransferase family 2 protein [Ignavibacteria bacterium]
MADSKGGLTIVIPCFNEEVSIKVFLPEVMKLASRNNWEVIVTNDGSTDSSATALEQLEKEYSCLKIITHNVNKGYGAALKSGILMSNTEFTATMDADGQHYPEDIVSLFAVRNETNADMVIGSRKDAKAGGAYRSFGKWIIRNLSTALADTGIYDINSGMKLFRTDTAKKMLSLCPDTMAFSNIIALTFAAQKNLVLEHPIGVRERTSGKSTININTAFDTILEILNIVMLFNPIRIFLPIALIFFFAGLLWGIPIMIAGRGVSVGAGLMMLTGVMIFLLGLIAEQLSHIRKSRL